MKKELIEGLTSDFENHSQTTENDIEFWFARDVQHLLGYAKWDNFVKVINKSKTACETSDNEIIEETTSHIFKKKYQLAIPTKKAFS